MARERRELVSDRHPVNGIQLFDCEMNAYLQFLTATIIAERLRAIREAIQRRNER